MTCSEFKSYDDQTKAFKMLMRNIAATWFDELEQQITDGPAKTTAEKWEFIKE